MKGYLVHFVWDWAGDWYGLVPRSTERRSCYWIPVNAYAENQLATMVAWLTGGNTWVKTDDVEWPETNKRRIQVYQYYIVRVEL